MADGSFGAQLASLTPDRRALFEQIRNRRSAETVHELSMAQRGLWFLDRLMPASALYAGSWRFDIEGHLDHAALRAALELVMARHEALRTQLGVRDGRPVQLVLPSCPIPLDHDDLRHEPPERRETALARIVEHEARTGLDLHSAPLFRMRLVRVEDDRHVAIMTTSHMVIDGISCEILVTDLWRAYETSIGVTTEPWPPAHQFSEYVSWQQERLNGPAGEQMLAFWRRTLAGAPPLLEFPTGRVRSADQKFSGRLHSFRLEREQVEPLTRLAAAERATPFMAYVAVVALLLSRYTGRPDVCVGTPVANRRREHAGMIGFCTNMVVVRVDCGGDPTFRELLNRVRQVCLDVYAHQEMPFDRLVDALAPERSVSYNPLFQVACALGDDSGDTSAAGGLALSPVETVSTGMAKFDLSLPAVLRQGEVHLTAEYSTAVLDDEMARRLAGHLTMLWAEAARRPDVAVSRLEMLRPEEVQPDPVRLKKTESLAATLAAHGADRPDMPAVTGPDGVVTYRRLAETVTGFAAHEGARPSPLLDAIAAALPAPVAAYRPLEIVAQDRIAVFGPPGSARFTVEVTAALAAGAQCLLAPPDLLGDPAATEEFLRQHEITVAWLPRRLLERMKPPRLRILVTDPDYRGGVTGETRLVRMLASREHGPIAYGTGGENDDLLVVAPGVHALVLDRQGLRLPAGLVGELHAATAEPAAPSMTSTGYMAKRLEDGRLQVHGAAADWWAGEVPVSLTAVEAVLTDRPEIAAAYVVRQVDSDGAQLVAFIVPADGNSDSDGDLRRLRAVLSDRLPPPMMPKALVGLPTLALTGQGQVDHGALPWPLHSAEIAFVPPRNALERLVVSTWVELFGRERIGMEDNFFDLGGNSLLATRLLSHVNELFGAQLPISVLFGVSTPAGLAGRLVEAVGGEESASALAASIEQILRLSEEEVQRLAGEAA